ncbi:pseudouridine synthase [Clostridium pasteurianum DSM 525 = ATCC 6013]|uniref:Pseudouridine synthase n=1 Tax=Clostridium pasteurianum DSM 525 = ATCC 6013 TaxID=1262449 RepID=A0A0H3J6A2_CLOPA|nr:pseudouridine synthase [Clostridium pasteurianum]AJA47433.1 pseudouridine synthase [Clostridium pasteurianum DSM 525 = ATCC 6013]AJA51421.1 pseudouridine synthase [Clostridium pasteurianum DSM 525 = ATCC 6013]AOZ74759.1 16S rRNA pseudouridine(516) synthase [Clostridium pasteurianum DSM 525 = ATCC 6013]AOZ78555.1 16S rRNA pseudouridine(516) synthase [Clostridium pasteurianum]ELP58768.1 ribosomal small subunit pseudouridine synthase A [Clostridium pasteurianum DSM 525 = ATCC 6013]
MERLDKILANSGYGSRKDVKKLIKSGLIEVDGKKVKSSNIQVDVKENNITVKGETLIYKKHIYLMMNKPAGVVSATFDNYDETVIDLLEEYHASFNPFPVGRLDKDTVGLLILTNDGDLNHKMISPKWHVNKVYYAEIDKVVDEEDIRAFEDGIEIDDGYKCMPAKLDILNVDSNGSRVMVTIQEGKFHQVKRMFLARNKKVVYLKRVSFGRIHLDESIKEGDYRELTEGELKQVLNSGGDSFTPSEF